MKRAQRSRPCRLWAVSRHASPHVRRTLRPLIGPLLAVVLATTALAAAPAGGASVAPTASTRTFHVATNGSDSASGTSESPLRSIGRAISRASSGDSVVVHAGTYHEGIVIPDGKRLSIVGRGDVWLEGSRPVTRWRSDSRGFVSDGWTAEFDSSPTYTWGEEDNTEDSWSFLNPARPMAAHPDQVWVNGRPQQQVESLTDVRPGTFYVDEAGDRLHLGTDPGGKEVRASDIAKAISIRAAGTRISNINVRGFAPSVPHMGAVTAERPGIKLERMQISDNATTGLHVMGANTLLSRVRLARNGMLGMSATYADNLRIIRSAAGHNNTEGFNYSPVAGGIKIGRSRGVLVRGGTFANNAGTGLWLDESTYGIKVTNSLVRDNRHHGISLEISAKATVTDTVIAGNASNGIKVNNTSRVSLWNNTLVGNGRPINIVQDDRDPTDPRTPGRDPRQPRPDPTMTWIVGPVQVHNNILAGPNSNANCLLCVEDFSERFTAEQLRVSASSNVYQRRTPALPVWAVVWSRAALNPAVFETVLAFRRATGQEARHLELIGTRALTGEFRPTRVVRRHFRIAEPIPRSIARIARFASGERHLGAWLR
jgi:hypothetical protein